MWILVKNSEDGEPSFHVYNKEADLLKEITPDEDGSTYYGNIKFADKLPEDTGIQNWDPETVYIFKAELVTPKPKTVVKEYTLS